MEPQHREVSTTESKYEFRAAGNGAPRIRAMRCQRFQPEFRSENDLADDGRAAPGDGARICNPQHATQAEDRNRSRDFRPRHALRIANPRSGEALQAAARFGCGVRVQPMTWWHCAPPLNNGLNCRWQVSTTRGMLPRRKFSYESICHRRFGIRGT